VFILTLGRSFSLLFVFDITEEWFPL